MLEYFTYPYDRLENLDRNSIIATYLIFNVTYKDSLKKAGSFAIGQTIGTWIKVPGVSAEMIKAYQGRVIGLYPAGVEEPVFVLRVVFPEVNFADSYVMMLTALVGNDVSTALQTKLIDLEFGDAYLNKHRGPVKKIADLRSLTGVYERPLVLNMIKPCVGFTPEVGAKLFFDVAKGGVDLIKDDELLGSPVYNPVSRRIKEYLLAAREAYQYSGKYTIYMPNISGTPKQLHENAKALVDAGGKACMVNFVFSSFDVIEEFCEEFGDKLFIMGHYAGMGVLEQMQGGISENIILGLLPRLSGLHAVMTMNPNHTEDRDVFNFHKTIQAQQLPLGKLLPVVTAVGGGLTPINQVVIQAELGKNIILGIGGAIQGHPAGTTIGAQTVMVAVQAAAQGITLEEAAENCRGLQEAIEIWGN